MNESFNPGLAFIVGAQIVHIDDGTHPILTLDDGRVVTFEGVGYDGLWTEVIATVEEVA